MNKRYTDDEIGDETFSMLGSRFRTMLRDAQGESPMKIRDAGSNLEYHPRNRKISRIRQRVSMPFD
ncbi:MAG: hypothetical protein K0U72_07175 [Gammaproteobacteria bacterium]|nr:hypothetical protein [Gammaproteobacteria bacterium]